MTGELAPAEKYRSKRITLSHQRAASLIVGPIVSLLLLYWFFSGQRTDFGDASATGAQTTSIFGSVDGYKLHCSDIVDAAECINGAIARHANRSVLWLGNSQLHAVNQLPAEGGDNAPLILFKTLQGRGYDLVTFSQPNANIQEHYVVFEYLRRWLPITMLILPVVFDDMREDGLRQTVAGFVDDERVRSSLARTQIGTRLIEQAQEEEKESDTSGLADTFQDKTERLLNVWLEQHSVLWSARPEIRGQIYYGLLYRMRNTIFGISASTKRQMIPGRYRLNLEALSTMLQVAHENGITAVVYIAPFRHAQQNPYIETEYSQFKKDVKSIVESNGARYANLEDLVPETLWGTKSSTNAANTAEVDFMHFTLGGHELLATTLAHLVQDSVQPGDEPR